MAKRYKEKNIKKTKRNFLILVIIIIIIIIFLYNDKINQLWNNIFNFKENNISINEEVKLDIDFDKNKGLNSNLLNISELDNEIHNIIVNSIQNIGECEIIKIHYQLEEINKGKIYVYYKIANNKLVKTIINMENKLIESIEEEENTELLKKDKIIENLSEDIEEEFYKKKEEITKEYMMVNIIVTNTEVVINTEPIQKNE